MSSWKQKFNKKYGFDKDEPHSKEEIAKITKIKKKILDEVYDRGVGAWENNIRSGRLKSGKKDFSVTDRSKKMTADLVVPFGLTMNNTLAAAALPSTIALVSASKLFKSPMYSSTKPLP